MSSSEETDMSELMMKAFPIEDMDREFDLDIPPTSGMEYLQRVQLEAKQCPAVVVADIDASSFKQQQTFKVFPNSGLHPAPSGYAPCIKCQRQQTAMFSSARERFCQAKAKMRKENKLRKDLPDKNDVDGWCNLCFGLLQPLKTTDTELHKTNENKEKRGTPPLLSILASMDQPTVIQVLEYHVNWFEATGFTEEQAQWFYALLMCLEKPLDPEVCSLIRNLARNCANLRASLESGSDWRLAPLNLIICLVAQYFDQTDLADNIRRV